VRGLSLPGHLRVLTPMSMVLEMAQRGRKAGHVCSRDYRNGPNCPLILRTTSEDAMTANVFGILRRLRPSLWLRPLLNHAFRTKGFRSRSLAGLDISFWQSVSPPATRASIEGSSEVDVMIRARDLAVFVEVKYQAALSTRTTSDESRDQVIRLLDVAFEMTTAGQMFTRSPYLLVLGSSPNEPALVTKYRDPVKVEEALGHRRRHHDHHAIAALLARRLGYASWSDLVVILEDQIPKATPTERPFLSDIALYVREKMATLHLTSAQRRQMMLPVLQRGESDPECST
jgi:hypothetical protein